MAAEDDVAALQLGGFALGETLADLNLDQDSLAAVQAQLGITGAAFSRDSIYNDKFEDDPVEEVLDTRTDYEDLVNQEIESERYLTNAQQPARGRAALARGEEDDFDEDDDEEEQAAAAVPMAVDPATAVQVKREPSEDYDEDEPAQPQSNETVQPSASAVTAAAPEDAPMEVGSPSFEAIAAPPPLRQVPVKELFPRFDKGKTLDFTELFSTRPRKRTKKVYHPAQRESFPSQLRVSDVVADQGTLPSFAQSNCRRRTSS